MYYDDIESAYQVLGIDSSASNEEIKKAYRKIAMENHPDKVGHLGEDIRKAAEEQKHRQESFQQVAYEGQRTAPESAVGVCIVGAGVAVGCVNGDVLSAEQI